MNVRLTRANAWPRCASSWATAWPRCASSWATARLARTYTGSPGRACAALNAGWLVGASERSAEVVVIAVRSDVTIVSTSTAATETTARKHIAEASAHLRGKDDMVSERRERRFSSRAAKRVRVEGSGERPKHTIQFGKSSGC